MAHNNTLTRHHAHGDSTGISHDGASVAREWIGKQKPEIQETRGDEPSVVRLPIRFFYNRGAYSFATKYSHEKVKTTNPNEYRVWTQFRQSGSIISGVGLNETHASRQTLNEERRL